MNNLKRSVLNHRACLILLLSSFARAGDMKSQDSSLVITKDLFGATGSALATSSDNSYALAFAWGEAISGDVSSEPPYSIISGYFGGRFGNSQTIQLLSWKIGLPGKKTFFQDQVQVGVPFDAPIQLTFSQPLNYTTIKDGYSVLISADHLGQPSSGVYSSTFTLDTTGRIITITPSSAWSGNTLYDVRLTAQIQDFDGFPLDQTYDIYFVSMLDHRQENVVLDPIAPSGASAGFQNSPVGIMSIDIPKESLSDFSAVLLSRDPMTSPLHVDPTIIQEANDKARAAGGVYRIPLAVQEITAFNANGDRMGPLSRQAQLTISYGSGSTASSGNTNLIRPQTLSLWTLDESHKLWVKIPASQNALGFRTVSAPVTQLSVFALMGSADGSARDTFVFPVPWRPHGPNAGTGAGQSGTEADGLNFSNLPSECTIKIYTIAGDLVREIHHSDTGGTIAQEKWDAKTTHGEPVASGVYLWRVESSVDSKNGKLMIIR